jgi:lipoprotein-anchoring transpeptidase ErfK/SrfK
MTASVARSALDHAWYLVRRGEVADARFWAGEAANFDPGLEEAWLILAALSDPNDSFEYLKKALDINPHSRRGNHGIAWAEAKTGRLFKDFISSFARNTNPYFQPYQKPEEPSFDIAAFAESLEPIHEDVSPIENYQQTQPDVSPFEIHPAEETTEESISPVPTIIRRKKRIRYLPAEPVNPWSVLLPYTVSFVLFFFFASVWLLSGLPSVMAQSLEPTQSAEQLVTQMLAENPIVTPTPPPTETPLPSKTPTKIPTITPTFTPEPTSTVIPPTPASLSDTDSNNLPVQFGDISAETLEDGRWIEVDLNNQMVRAYEGEELIHEFLVSTGTSAHPTVKGNFHIYVKYRYANMRGPGYYLTNVPYTMYFYQSYGLHGTYWHHNFGTPMSHGCVNLQTDDAAWLYQWASIGTLVLVH